MKLRSSTPDNPHEGVTPPSSSEKLDRLHSLKRIVWRGKIGEAFWNVASLISLTLNLVLIVALIVLGRELFTLKKLVEAQLLGGLYSNFVKMDEAHIATTIQVSDTIRVKDTIPVVFDLPLQQETQVMLTQNTPVRNATIFLNNQPVPLDLILKKGTLLTIALNLTVPVNQKVPVELNVPVNLNVPVDIALSQTELHEPFVGLQNVVYPYKGLLEGLPDSWDETPLCDPLWGWPCKLLLGTR